MKKALIGCLAVVLLVVVAGGIAGYVFIVRPAWDAGSELLDAAGQWQQVAALEQDVDNRAPYDAPDGGTLTAAQVESFVAVQRAVHAALGDDADRLQAKYDAIERESGGDTDLRTAFGAYADLSNLIVAAKRAQVDALNARGMSLAEYRWIRNQAYTSIGLVAADETPAQLAGSEMAHNADLLRPHRDLLAETMAVTWLGF